MYVMMGNDAGIGPTNKVNTKLKLYGIFSIIIMYVVIVFTLFMRYLLMCNVVCQKKNLFFFTLFMRYLV